VQSVSIVDRATKQARVIVPDYQLSLAIGREGQNARLAHKLTGWRIDIRSDTAPDGPDGPDSTGGSDGTAGADHTDGTGGLTEPGGATTA
jgi:N utilization substance protein A